MIVDTTGAFWFDPDSCSYTLNKNSDGTISTEVYVDPLAWIDDVFLKWVTTGYYREGLNRAADEMNVNGEFRNIISTSWQPLYAISTYQAASKNKNIEAFSYRPTDKKSETARLQYSMTL